MPPVRVAIASPLKRSAAMVARQDGSALRVIITMASAAHVIAAAKGTSIGVKNRLP
jgi:hypothetical protein